MWFSVCQTETGNRMWGGGGIRTDANNRQIHALLSPRGKDDGTVADAHVLDVVVYPKFLSKGGRESVVFGNVALKAHRRMPSSYSDVHLNRPVVACKGPLGKSAFHPCLYRML